MEVLGAAVTLAVAALSFLGGFLSNALRARANARTAARLVHAELLQNAAGVLHYRDTGRLVGANVRRAAWDAHGETLAKVRDASAFTAINESYVALEALTYITEASRDERVPADLEEVLEQAVERLIGGLDRSGRLAGIPEG